jgi:predicted O-methyltransferase YrrM
MVKPFEQRGGAIIRRLPQNARVAEVGVLIGILSEYLLRNRTDITLYMVDSWLEASEQPDQYRATGDVHANHNRKIVRDHRAQAENRARKYASRALVMPIPSLAAANRFNAGELDLVFLDADHSYAGVSADIAAWLPKVKPGGWIGGHDYENPDPAFRFGVTEAVDEWAEATGRKIETDANFTWFARV